MAHAVDVDAIVEGLETRTVCVATARGYICKIKRMAQVIHKEIHLFIPFPFERDLNGNIRVYPGTDLFIWILPMDPRNGERLFALLSVDGTLPSRKRLLNDEVEQAEAEAAVAEAVLMEADDEGGDEIDAEAADEAEANGSSGSDSSGGGVAAGMDIIASNGGNSGGNPGKFPHELLVIMKL